MGTAIIVFAAAGVCILLGVIADVCAGSEEVLFHNRDDEAFEILVRCKSECAELLDEYEELYKQKGE